MNSIQNKPDFIVGVGASAGGLEALQSFFSHLPEDTGLAFIVIQHLSPDFKSLMDQLLAKLTNMKIVVAENEMAVERNTVYLIPPKVNMTINRGFLFLTQQTRDHNLNLPIDIFFKSLAEDAQSHGIAVILSGTGSDGSRGVLEISEHCGLVIVQDPEEAKFDGMPKSALSTNAVNKVLVAADIPKYIGQYVANPSVQEKHHEKSGSDSSDDLYAQIFTIIYNYKKIDFSEYKEKTIYRRIERRLKALLLNSLEDYVARLKSDEQEKERLCQDLLIRVTSFFRDQTAFEFLAKEVIPNIFHRNSETREIRIWVAGCASGEEVYSIAILFKEYSEKIKQAYDIKIFGSDINREALAYANQGVYNESQIVEIAPHHVEQFFKKRDNQYYVSAELRNMVVFAAQNVLTDPPFTKVDLVVCRNLLIYLKQSVQERVISSFHFALKKNGYLFLGPSEGLGNFSRDFATESSSFRMFRKTNDSRFPLSAMKASPNSKIKPVQARPGNRLKVNSITSSSYDRILEHLLHDCIVLNADEEVLHLLGNAKNYLSFQSGRMSNNIGQLIDDELRSILLSGLFRAEKEATPVRFENIKHSQIPHPINLIITPIFEPDTLTIGLYLIHFEDGVEHVKQTKNYDVSDTSKHIIKDLELQLRISKEELNTALEESETTNEELQATNEELLASNEELQSTNEELHSVNEELYTVNSEFQKKIEELTTLEDDIDNLLQSANIGTIFIDKNLNIRRITPAISKNFGILNHDIGRSIESFVYKFNHENLIDVIHGVMGGGVERTLPARIYNENWYVMKVIPYMVNRSIGGAVITFLDINEVKSMEEKLDSSEHRFIRSHQDFVDFAYFSSTDLKGLLQGFSLHLNKLIDDFPKIKSNESWLALHQDGETLGRIVDCFSKFSNISQMEMKLEDVDLTALIGDLTRRFKSAGCTFFFDDDLPHAFTDHSAISYILEALIMNGVVYNHSSKKVIELGVIDSEGDAMTTIYVRDNGQGIPARDLEGAFKMFRQLGDPGESSVGLGVGLSFSRRFADRLGGKIWLESEENVGTTAYLQLPKLN
ncbi:CheR family methyltransferase [Pseudobacteriovorax antillogorgiicola]|uniref:protein-glutamate O-methyltransferase n=1 Tax=Pseudobacteriovorax antillogorgiicola TaxID=1513793 RepID=A0A1Y6BHV8_9BACT|nr:CheR family methyltransferase [Pseudobacteriovorax antillogorgiicola]TCS56477.1 two-component system CheB/CheR fusion protein [Pseudobacteriovorax antillogorgiicola]SMF04970.1 two-component system, chemotaxis family, CheB/CheR fusion protein [Pseudobacteriovorax antillogorgiicola]